MKVSLRVSGGLLGLTGGAAHVVDSGELPAAERAELTRLVRAATTEPGTPPASRAGRADAQSYTIHIHDLDSATELRATDGAVPPEFAALRNFLRRR